MKKYFFLILVLWGCSQKQQLKKQNRKMSLEKERIQLDSLYLVKSLPIRILNHLEGDFSFQTILSEQLTLKGFTLISDAEFLSLIHENIRKVHSGDQQKLVDKMRQDPQYIMKKIASVPPYAQIIMIHPCDSAKEDCIEIERYNTPHSGRKEKEWVFYKKESMTTESFASSIIDVLDPARL